MLLIVVVHRVAFVCTLKAGKNRHAWQDRVDDGYDEGQKGAEEDRRAAAVVVKIVPRSTWLALERGGHSANLESHHAPPATLTTCKSSR